MGWNLNPGVFTLDPNRYAALPRPVLEAGIEGLSLIFLLLVRSQELLVAKGGRPPLCLSCCFTLRNLDAEGPDTSKDPQRVLHEIRASLSND